MRLVIADQVYDDLERFVDFDDLNQEQAKRLFNQFYQHFNKIAHFPKATRVHCDDIRAYKLFRPYVITYSLVDDTVRIRRLFHRREAY